jgi:hypothetical protein
MRLLVLAACLALAGCSLLYPNGGAESDFEDVYDYTAYDGAGGVVVTGTLYLVHVPNDVAGEPDYLQGRWVLRARAEGVGPQDGQGTLGGTAERDGTFYVNLNPEMADNNVFLRGAFQDERARMEGEWSYTTFVGEVAGGRFEAVRTRRATQHHVAG